MTDAARIVELALPLVRDFEGYRSKAYRCPAGVWTVGYGQTEGVTSRSTCTREQAETWLRDDLSRRLWRMRKDIDEPDGATDSHWAGMLSFAYNVGVGAFAKSTLRRKFLAGDFEGAAGEFGRWTKAGGNVLPGLERRRQAERELFERTT